MNNPQSPGGMSMNYSDASEYSGMERLFADDMDPLTANIVNSTSFADYVDQVINREVTTFFEGVLPSILTEDTMAKYVDGFLNKNLVKMLRGLSQRQILPGTEPCLCSEARKSGRRSLSPSPVRGPPTPFRGPPTPPPRPPTPFRAPPTPPPRRPPTPPPRPPTPRSPPPTRPSARAPPVCYRAPPTPPPRPPTPPAYRGPLTPPPQRDYRRQVEYLDNSAIGLDPMYYDGSPLQGRSPIAEPRTPPMSQVVQNQFVQSMRTPPGKVRLPAEFVCGAQNTSGNAASGFDTEQRELVYFADIPDTTDIDNLAAELDIDTSGLGMEHTWDPVEPAPDPYLLWEEY